MNLAAKLAVSIAAALIAACATVNEGAVRSSGEDADSSAAWASLDLDNDGVLSPNELETQRAMGLLQDFPNADANHDRGITKAEFDAWWSRMTNHFVRSASDDTPALESAR